MIDILDIVSLFPPDDENGGVIIDPLPSPTQSFLEALRSRVIWLAPELKGVYLSSSDPEAEFPFCIINKLWEEEALNSIETQWLSEIRLQFTILSLDDVQAETLGKKVRKGLWPRSSNPMLRFVGGYEIGRNPERFMGPMDKMDDTFGDQKVWRTMFDYTWRIGVNDV